MSQFSWKDQTFFTMNNLFESSLNKKHTHSTPNWASMAKPKPYLMRETESGFCISNGVDHHYLSTAMDIYHDMYKEELYEELKLVPTFVMTTKDSPDTSWAMPVLPPSMSRHLQELRMKRCAEVLKSFGIIVHKTNLYRVLTEVTNAK